MKIKDTMEIGNKEEDIKMMMNLNMMEKDLQDKIGMENKEIDLEIMDKERDIEVEIDEDREEVEIMKEIQMIKEKAIDQIIEAKGEIIKEMPIEVMIKTMDIL